MTKLIGIIAEDVSDVDVIQELMRKLARKPFSLKKIVGQGSGRVRSKCRVWADLLKQQGCSVLILVHDLDVMKLSNLRQTLIEALSPSPIAKHAIIIPVRELEAWLLADHLAIAKTFSFKKPLAKIANPEAIQRPKEKLRDIVERGSNRKVIYINTIHNRKIAKNCKSVNLSRCPSYQPFRALVEQVLG